MRYSYPCHYLAIALVESGLQAGEAEGLFNIVPKSSVLILPSGKCMV